jgi:Rps23 Pro-64 3,4-dihydroxylase Tpa1-like proline 4-hydroxylase
MQTSKRTKVSPAKPNVKAVRRLRIVDGFSQTTRALRAHFDARFADPRKATGDRFVWDYWHVPGQYTHLRTPAHDYFPAALYQQIHTELALFGRNHLGCHDISPLWLSAYVEGCKQEIHGDLPHGPFAFVLSLSTGHEKTFRGGETLLAREDMLDYFRDFRSVRSVEHGDVFEAVAPKFNRLTVFDGRIPHGVREVRGTHDPREGRLVLHGWFVSPRPFVTGPLAPQALGAAITKVTTFLGANMQDLPLAGMISLGFDVTPQGNVQNLCKLSDTTRVPGEYEPARRALLKGLLRVLGEHVFPVQRRQQLSKVILPLVFEGE